jgi:hypothetical protein
MPGQGAGEVHDILGLAPGVGIATQLEVLSANKTVDAEQADIDPCVFAAGWRDGWASLR